MGHGEELFEFLKRMGRHWRTLLTGSALAACLTVYGYVVQKMPLWLIRADLIITLLWAAFSCWRDEYRELKTIKDKRPDAAVVVKFRHLDDVEVKRICEIKNKHRSDLMKPLSAARKDKNTSVAKSLQASLNDLNRELALLTSETAYELQAGVLNTGRSTLTDWKLTVALGGQAVVLFPPGGADPSIISLCVLTLFGRRNDEAFDDIR